MDVGIEFFRGIARRRLASQAMRGRYGYSLVDRDGIGNRRDRSE